MTEEIRPENLTTTGQLRKLRRPTTSQNKNTLNSRKWRAENKEANKIIRAREQKIQQAKNRDYLDSLKTKACCDCLVTFPPECMDFDHVRGEKLFGINTQTAAYKKERIEAEVAKCDLVCSNCHRSRTKKRMIDPDIPLPVRGVVTPAKAAGLTATGKTRKHKKEPSQSSAAIYTREWRARNPEKSQAAIVKATQIGIASQRAWLDAVKTKPCLDCCKKFPPESMDLDHVRGVKLFSINTQTAGLSLERREAELAKCDLVCSNCHRIRTKLRLLGKDTCNGSVI